jgi:hypothetical protein
MTTVLIPSEMAYFAVRKDRVRVLEYEASLRRGKLRRQPGRPKVRRASFDLPSLFIKTHSMWSNE